jgi:hypothetical protein
MAGRPLGYSPGVGLTHTHHVGEWAWNSPLLHSKIKVKKGCWEWLGAKGPSGNLFGAYKNNRPQMTQPNRLLYMEMTDESAADISVYMSCQNKNCCNPAHFEVLPNKVKGYSHVK